MSLVILLYKILKNYTEVVNLGFLHECFSSFHFSSHKNCK